MNPFLSLTRTVLPDSSHVLDAIDADGRAWWLIVGNRDGPWDWTELLPLPGSKGPSDEELLELRRSSSWMSSSEEFISIARTVLAHWGR